ncbi:MAG: hypothetical protein ACT4PN_08985 [Nitrospiraceae bacterium]
MRKPLEEAQTPVTDVASVIDELKRRGVLAQAMGAKPTFQYSI